MLRHAEVHPLAGEHTYTTRHRRAAHARSPVQQVDSERGVVVFYAPLAARFGDCLQQQRSAFIHHSPDTMYRHASPHVPHAPQLRRAWATRRQPRPCTPLRVACGASGVRRTWSTRALWPALQERVCSMPHPRITAVHSMRAVLRTTHVGSHAVADDTVRVTPVTRQTSTALPPHLRRQ